MSRKKGSKVARLGEHISMAKIYAPKHASRKKHGKKTIVK